MLNALLAAALGSLAAVASHADAPSAPIWAPSSEAPPGLLTPREVQLHDFFVELARSASSCPRAPLRQNCRPGGIDVVFFGSTFAEMWWWENRGMPAWTGLFSQRKAANFGSQGSRPESLLWRMRHGELDGYQAKLVVLWLSSTAQRLDRAAIEDAYGPVVAEIRARQPQAKVLVFGTRPEVEASAGFIDERAVFYAAAPELRATDPEGYRARAEQLKPWLARFVD